MAIEFYDSLNIDSNDDSYFLGNVGIGTTSPSEKLHVVGSARVTGAYYDSGNLPGTTTQVLSSTATGTSWIDQGDIVAAGATKVLIACKNTSGATITKGTPVYQTGNVGATDVIEIAEADALISTGYLPAIGLLETDLIDNAFGNVVITGELLNITTDPIDGQTPTTGDTIYLKSGGGLTLTKPTGEGNAIQNLGLVGKVSGGSAGSITVASIMRQNDVPNLTTGRIWVGAGNTVESTVVYLDETNGRMGIGTASPAEKLDVNGTVNLTNLKIATAQGTDGQVLTSTGSGIAWEDASNPWVADTNGITYTAGNVGIGIASQAALDLAVNGDARFNSNLRLDGSFLDVNGATGTSGQILSSEGAGGGVEWIDAGVKSSTTGEPSGSDQVINIVSLTQAEYDAGSPNATTLYIIT